MRRKQSKPREFDNVRWMFDLKFDAMPLREEPIAEAPSATSIVQKAPITAQRVALHFQ
jgi:hypothetical protein